MQTEKKVKIELPAIDGTKPDTPVKPKKHKGQPSDFQFIPKFAPQLAEYVQSVKWDSLEKTLDLVVKETPHFEVYEWTEHIKKKTAEAMKGPFNVDLDSDIIVVKFLDSTGEVNTTMSFRNITLEKHRCKLGKKLANLKHRILLAYENVEKMEPDECREWTSALFSVDHQNEEADDEWQSVEEA
tara:strand:- start:150 stop:701 length:552 start_codon:yes stop_codon:yes gene_type:complete